MLTLLTDTYEPELPKGSIAIFDRELRPRDDGDLVLVTLRWRSHPSSEMIVPFTRRGGYDYSGRFCSPGSPQEVIASVGCIKYSRKDFTEMVTIQATMCGWMRSESLPRISRIS
jgi:hypothetical protein